MRKKKIRREVERYRESRGAVAVFITIILVPCIVVASLFVDVSRVQYSKMEAYSAADLALDAALAGYDRILNDYYGLVASCQNSDEFLEKSREYFTGMMRAEGNDTGADIFTEFIKQIQNGTVADFLKTDILEEVTVEPVEKSNLEENPALIEDGIVEFMKYRGLVPLGNRIVDLGKRIANIEGFDELADADSNKDVVEAKQEYGEAESKLLKDAFNTYLAIRLYEKDQESSGFPSDSEYQDISNKLNGMRDDLYDVTTVITLYYAGTDGIDYVNFPSIGKNEYTSDPRYTPSGIGSGYIVNGKTVYYIYKDTYDRIMNLVTGTNCELERYENAIKEAADRIENSCSGLRYNNGTTNPAIWCYKIQQAISRDDLNTIRTYMDSVMQIYAQLKGAQQCEPDPLVEGEAALPTTWKDDLDYAAKTIDRLWSDYLREGDFDYGGGAYNELRKTYQKVAYDMDTVNKVRSRSYRFDSVFGEKTVGEFASEAASYINDRINLIDERIEELDKPINGGKINWNGQEYEVVSFEQLKKEARDKDTAFNKWEKKADEHKDSTYVKDVDKPEIDKIKANLSDEEAKKAGKDKVAELSHDFEKRIDEASVDELKQRLEHIREDLKKCKESFEKLTYGNKKVKGIYDAETYIQAAINGGVDKNEIGLSITDGENKAKEYAKSLVAPTEEDVYKFDGFDSGEDGSNPNLSKDTPKLYKYMKDKFQSKEDQILNDTKDAEKKLEEFKEMRSSAADFAKISKMDPIAEEECGKDKIEDISTSETGNALSAISSFVKYVNQIINGDGGVTLGNVRDKIYVTEYVMDMLTYATTNNEGRYKQNESATFKDYESRYNFTEWGKTDAIKIPEDQSLTNKCFCLENNKALLGEAEYILYGKPTVQENVAQVYYRIFAIREILDITSGFILFWGLSTKTGTTINSLADAIAGATMGFVPAVLTKTIIILALATIEAGKDLEYLKKGVGVRFYKTKESHWLCSLSGKEDGSDWRNNTIKQDGTDTDKLEDRLGLYYSDYLYVFFLFATQNEAYYKNMLLRIGDIIEINVGQQKSGFDLKKSYCYYRLNATMQVKPLMLSMPIIDSYKDVDVPTFRSNSIWCQYKVDAVRGYS